MYDKARYASPTLGRWLSRNPNGYAGGMNLYEYSASSPVNGLGSPRLGGSLTAQPPWRDSPTVEHLGVTWNAEIETDWQLVSWTPYFNTSDTLTETITLIEDTDDPPALNEDYLKLQTQQRKFDITEGPRHLDRNTDIDFYSNDNRSVEHLGASWQARTLFQNGYVGPSQRWMQSETRDVGVSVTITTRNKQDRLGTYKTQARLQGSDNNRWFYKAFPSEIETSTDVISAGIKRTLRRVLRKTIPKR